MSLKRKFQSQYRHFTQAIFTWRFPLWLTCPATRIILILLIVIFSSAYIFKTASSAASGYQINELEKELYKVESDIKKIEVEIAINSSMSSIQNRLSGSNMVAVDKIGYYSLEDIVVVKR